MLLNVYFVGQQVKCSHYSVVVCVNWLSERRAMVSVYRYCKKKEY